MDRGKVARPLPWVGKRWSMREFSPETWGWQQPSKNRKLDILVGSPDERVRMAGITSHVCTASLPANAIIWLDEHTTMPSPPLLFAQMAETASIPALVLLGNELCGHFSRSADNPQAGPITDQLPAATSVSEIASFLEAAANLSGRTRAREALRYVSDHAISSPEAVLATMYSLPPKESGYGMGPVTLNRRISISDGNGQQSVSARYPDLLFSFAPVGINYDGEGHLDLAGLVQSARKAELADAENKQQAEAALSAKLHDVRSKAIDDIQRNRQLAASGYIVFPATKEDISEWGALDELTREILSCARTVFGADVHRYEETLEDTDRARDRFMLLNAMLPTGTSNHSEIL